MVTGSNKKFDDIFSLVDTMHQRDRRTDGLTPDDSEDRAYTHSVARVITQRRNIVTKYVPCLLVFIVSNHIHNHNHKNNL